MPRAVDLQLFAVAFLAGAGVGWLAAHGVRRHRVGALAVLGALLAGWVADRWFVDAVPPDLVDGLLPWVAGAVVGLVAARGATRLPVTPTAGVPPVAALVLASLAGVWAGVPETSAAILGAGAVVGVVTALHLAGSRLSRGAAAVLGLVPIGAAVIGAAGDRHALVGGLLCSGTVVALAARRRIEAVSDRSVVIATALQLAASLVAARQIAVVRGGDDATTLVAGIVVVALSLLAATSLRGVRRGRGRRRRAPW